MASDVASPEPFGAPERRERARAVAADLEAIFGARTAGAPAGPRARPIHGRPAETEAEAPHRLSAASMGAIAAAALAGIAAGVILVKRPEPAKAPTHPAALPVQMTPPAQTPQAADAALAAPVQAVPPPAALPAPRAAPARRPAVSRAEVMSADRRLRAAYASAIRAGVPRSELSDQRDRWSSARRRLSDEPARLTATYRDIAADLDRAAARARAHPPRATRPARAERRSRFHPRFPAWWR